MEEIRNLFGLCPPNPKSEIYSDSVRRIRNSSRVLRIAVNKAPPCVLRIDHKAQVAYAVMMALRERAMALRQ